MYSLSRVLPDETLRPISAGMTSRPEDTLACEVLPDERACVFADDEVVIAFGLDSDGHLQFHLGEDVRVVLLAKGDPTLVIIHRDAEVSRIKHTRYDVGDIVEDVRAFVQVFPLPQSVEPVPAG